MRKFVLGLALAASASFASAQGTFILSKDGSDVVCADISKGKVDTVVLAWVSGFWSGLNVAGDRHVGSETTVNGIIGEVQLFCEKHPSASLLTAVRATYFKLIPLPKRP